MQPIEVKQFLEKQIPNVQIEVEGEGCNFQLNIISDELLALSPVKRQQQIYSYLNPWIEDGRIHAITMKFYSHNDWATRN